MSIATLRPRLRRRKRLFHDVPDSDETLLRRYCETGSREVFAYLVRRYERELFNYLRRYLSDADMADDAFQATFLQVHLKCAHFDSSLRFRPWLYTIATHQAIDAQRRNRRHKAASLDRGSGDESEEYGKLADFLESNAPSPLHVVSEAERNEWLKGALEDLPEGLRQVINLVYYQGLMYREAADIMKIPVGTVKSRMHGAILKLNEKWNATYQDPQ